MMTPLEIALLIFFGVIVLVMLGFFLWEKRAMINNLIRGRNQQPANQQQATPAAAAAGQQQPAEHVTPNPLTNQVALQTPPAAEPAIQRTSGTVLKGGW